MLHDVYSSVHVEYTQSLALRLILLGSTLVYDTYRYTYTPALYT